MGTTVTALLLAEGKLHFAHIGDSRAYRLRNGEFEQVSVDHTFVQRLIDEGRLRPEEAETHPHKNVLMRVLGDVDASPELDLDTLDVEPGERWLLCSDGLNYVAGHVVERTVRETRNLRECVELLVDLTLEAGAPDNVTVVMLEIAEQTHRRRPTAAVEIVPALSPSTVTATVSGDAPRRTGSTLWRGAGARSGERKTAAAEPAAGKPDGPAPPARTNRQPPRIRTWASIFPPKCSAKNFPAAPTNSSALPPLPRKPVPSPPSRGAPWPAGRPPS